MTPSTNSPESSPSKAPWPVCIERFLSGGGRFSQSTVQTYRPALRRFSEVATERGYDRPADIDAHLLELYGQALREWNPAPRTLSLHVVCVRRFIGWLQAHGAQGLPQVWQIKDILRFEAAPQTSMTATARPDLKRMLVAKDASPRDRAIWALAAFAGLKATEIARLKLESFQHDGTGWTVEVQRSARKVPRNVPLVDEVSRALTAYLRETGRRLGRAKGFVFEAEDPYAEKRATQGLSRQSVYNVIRKTAEALGIETCNPRQLRNAFGVLFLRAGGDLSQLQELMGHESAAATSVYLQAEQRSIARETLERQLALVESTDETLMSAGDRRGSDSSSDLD